MRYLLIAAIFACGMSREEFEKFRVEKAACVAGDACVLAGQIQCACAVPINAKNVAEVEDAAKDVDCTGVMVDCVQFTNPRCQDGRCVADAATQ